MKNSSTKIKQRGFSLIELILVLGISSLAFLGFLQIERERAEATTARLAGLQIQEVGTALEVYIQRNAAALTAAIPNNTTSANLPLTILQGTAFGAFPGTFILPLTYVNRNVLGGAYNLRIRNENGNIMGLVVTNQPIADSVGAVQYSWAGTAVRYAGPQAGVAFLTNTMVSGFNGSWTLTSAQFPNITAAGQLAFRAQGINSVSYDNVYLRLDGAFPMRGDLNLGNFDINNVTDLNSNGFINANNINAVLINSGAINNAGNITNIGQIDSTGRIISRTSIETNFINRTNALGSRDVVVGDAIGGAIANQGSLHVGDIFIRGGRSVTGRPALAGGTGAWLSDLLPRYSSRGVALVQNGNWMIKPQCPIGGMANARIVVIPQAQHVQSRVAGSIHFPAQTANLTAVGGFAAWAQNFPTMWQIHITTPAYMAGFQGVAAIAHVYCDNNF